MYRKILLAYDPERLADHAVPAVMTLAGRSKADVLIVAVQDRFFDYDSAEAMRRRVDGAVGRLVAAGIHARGQVTPTTFRSVAGTLLHIAGAYRPDLVVLGSHGRGTLGGMVLGSVGRSVAAGLDCAVMIVHCPADADDDAAAAPIRRVLLAVDFSDASAGAVLATRRLAAEHGSDVTVVHALEDVPFADGFAFAEDRSTATPLLEDAARRLRGAATSVDTRALPGPAPVADRIAQAADGIDADVIVVGSKRSRFAGVLLLGSVAHSVIRATARPVLLAERTVPAEAKAPEPQGGVPQHG